MQFLSAAPHAIHCNIHLSIPYIIHSNNLLLRQEKSEYMTKALGISRPSYCILLVYIIFKIYFSLSQWKKDYLSFINNLLNLRSIHIQRNKDIFLTFWKWPVTPTEDGATWFTRRMVEAAAVGKGHQLMLSSSKEWGTPLKPWIAPTRLSSHR